MPLASAPSVEEEPLTALRAAGHVRTLRLPRTARLEIAAWWAGSRLLVIAVASAAQVVRWPADAWHPSLFRHPLVLLGSWDGQWYRIVAAHGYLLIPGQPSDPAFFPLLPVV